MLVLKTRSRQGDLRPAFAHRIIWRCPARASQKRSTACLYSVRARSGWGRHIVESLKIMPNVGDHAGFKGSHCRSRSDILTATPEAVRCIASASRRCVNSYKQILPKKRALFSQNRSSISDYGHPNPDSLDRVGIGSPVSNGSNDTQSADHHALTVAWVACRHACRISFGDPRGFWTAVLRPRYKGSSAVVVQSVNRQ